MGLRTNRLLVSYASLMGGIPVGILIATADCLLDDDFLIPLIATYLFFQFVLPGFIVGRTATSRAAGNLFFDGLLVSVFGAAKANVTALLLLFLLPFFSDCEPTEAAGWYGWTVLGLSFPLNWIAGLAGVATARWFRAGKVRAAHGEVRTPPGD